MQAKERPQQRSVGGHVEARCGKCKDTTKHIVLAMLGGKPSRVECRTCHAVHTYRAPEAETSPARKAPSAKPPGKSAGGRKAAAAPPKVEEVWAKAMRSASGPPLPYSPRTRFEVGQRVRHSTFGEGVVTRIASETVCEMVFATGARRLLMCS